MDDCGDGHMGLASALLHEEPEVAGIFGPVDRVQLVVERDCFGQWKCFCGGHIG